MSSLHSGTWNPDNSKIPGEKSPLELFLNNFAKNINNSFNFEISNKFGQELNPYILLIKLSKNYLNFFEFNETNEISDNGEKKKLNIFTQFWNMIDWVLKQSSKNQSVLWIDFYCDYNKDSNSTTKNSELILKLDKNQPIFNSENNKDLFNNLISISGFKTKTYNKNDSTLKSYLNNVNLNNLLIKNKFACYMQMEINNNLLTDEITNRTLLSDVTKFLINFLKY